MVASLMTQTVNGKESAWDVAGRSPREGNGNPLQYSVLEKSYSQRSLAGYSPWGHKGSDTTEQLTHTHNDLFHFSKT